MIATSWAKERIPPFMGRRKIPAIPFRVWTHREHNGSNKRQNCRLSCRVKLSFRKINGNRRKCTHRTRATSDKIFQATKFEIFIISFLKRQFCRSLCVHTLSGAPCRVKASYKQKTFFPGVAIDFFYCIFGNIDILCFGKRSYDVFVIIFSNDTFI